MIVTLVLLGQVLEMRARHRTGAALRALLDLAPKEALRVADDGSETPVPLAQCTDLRVRPGSPCGGRRVLEAGWRWTSPW